MASAYIVEENGPQELRDYMKWKTARQSDGFPETPGDDVLRVYTTRPDTLFGATYMVIAPEHSFVEKLTTPEQKAAVDAYVRQASLKSDLDRTDLAKDKSGVFTGSYAINPVNGEKVPVWIADYVLISYGTGAIMAVPAHDLRDWEFAVKYDIPIIQVVQAPDGYEHSKDEKALARTVEGVEQLPFSGKGTAVNSGENDGTATDEFKAKIATELAAAGLGREAVNFKLRDWLFSRQRYWGEPFPIWHELDADGNETGLMRVDAADELPVVLPEMEKFKPTGTPEPMLSTSPESWLYKTAEDGTKLKRETNTMPQWAGSCWYYLRFADPKNSDCFLDPEVEKNWLPVDLYVGGAEHAVLHLLYARFWHKVLFDRGHVSTCEPFHKLVNQGMILGEADSETGKAEKMSKSRGNVINPDDVVDDYGADSLRLYEMFMGPLEQVKPWSMKGVEGVYRFLARVWRMITDEEADEVRLNPAVQEADLNEDQERILHKTIKAVTEDIEKLSFNTAISRMMEFTNEFSPQEVRPKSAMETLTILLSPFAPHMAEELWELLGHDNTLTFEPWPTFDESKIVEAEVEIPVQVNGKLKAKVKVLAGADNATIEEAAKQNSTVAGNLEGKTIVKVVVVPGRLVNFVVKG
jgi:leucyl-tRNA synthetase